jgi:2-amino-4-hydroxy-6-hydroxymethyldihydropteridine diphosphokinase
MAIVYIGLGSNLEDPVNQVLYGLDDLDTVIHTTCRAQSSLYSSPAMVLESGVSGAEPQNQPDYINAVAKEETALGPRLLLRELQHLEAMHNRKREERWGPRTLDLDILLYDDRCIESPELTVPHPGLYERNFVLYPLAEIAPDLDIPGLGLLAGLLEHCERGSLQKLTD